MKSQSFETIRYEEAGGIATIIFNRPNQLNALSRLMMRELTDVFGHVHRTAEIRVAIVTGSGRAFMAGADIKEYAGQTPAEFEEFQDAGRRMYAAAENNAKPLIAAVNGFALGGGFAFAQACDLVVAAYETKFGLPEVKLGLMPGGGGTFFLPSHIGLGRALDLMLTGRQVTAEELLSWGFVHRICSGTDLLKQAHELAQVIAGYEPAAVQAIKRVARLGTLSAGGAGFNEETEALARLYQSDAAKQRIQEFVAKSKK